MPSKSPRNSKTHLMAVRLPIWIADDLMKISSDTGCTITELIVEALEDYLALFEAQKRGG